MLTHVAISREALRRLLEYADDGDVSRLAYDEILELDRACIEAKAALGEGEDD